ncbi:NAD(P)-dependent oxidoreductase [Tunicatimonas pelagia]|uniref:NAD(P)-dependent oxidoreductase n=1 Tax=Tunicatimonas pelagia TaxID=931531 RepID=UPI0026651444|nr:NAD(P)-dependent oxidoreductase [Tunicatimonas pelagia]WKN45848.1 NAD(P)-dependent oxidoreductase [Tunicatimonas pelagia]
MAQPTIALIREDKVPVDHRVPLTPDQAVQVQEKFGTEVLCQSSTLRCFPDEEYRQTNIPVVDSVQSADILMGVKEVPIDQLIAGKSYLFFSHTIKKQAYNRDLLRAILEKNIRLIDYERLTNQKNQRVVAFGRFAGIVGAYNGLYTFGKKFGLYDIRRAKDCFDLADLRTEYAKIKLPAIKIAITGTGRVAQGATEVLNEVGIRQVDATGYLKQDYQEPVYTQLEVTQYNRKKDGKPFRKQEFYDYPEQFVPGFLPFAHQTDLLIAGAYWDSNSPVLFYRDEMLKEDFKIKVIADITCDIEGSIPSTKQPSTIDNPIYDYDARNDQVVDPYQPQNTVSVMAVDNLPSELPRDASHAFGEALIAQVLPNLLGSDEGGMIARATITKNGKLTEPYRYLQDFVDGKE